MNAGREQTKIALRAIHQANDERRAYLATKLEIARIRLEELKAKMVSVRDNAYRVDVNIYAYVSDVEDWIRDVDRALYESKPEGR